MSITGIKELHYKECIGNLTEFPHRYSNMQFSLSHFFPMKGGNKLSVVLTVISDKITKTNTLQLKKHFGIQYSREYKIRNHGH